MQASRFEMEIKAARKLGIAVTFKTEKKTFRGNLVEVISNVTINDEPSIENELKQTQVVVKNLEIAVEKSIHGAKQELIETNYMVDFLENVLSRYYLPVITSSAPAATPVAQPVAQPIVEPVAQPVQPIVEPVVKPVEIAKGADALTQLQDTLLGIFVGQKADEIAVSVRQKVQAEVKDFIEAEYGHIEKHVEFVRADGSKVSANGVLHERFDEVCQFVSADEPVFLVGPAGCGKNHLCKQVADALGLDFYFSNAVTQEYKLTGFTDAMGVFQQPQFYKAFKDGGLFLLDEMDASIPEVLVILNAAIANKYFDFPAPIGMVQAHPNFRVVAAGNTVGKGASYEYVGRTQLDAATLDRFAVVDMDYDVRVETACAEGNKELVNFCHDVRKACKDAGISIVVSYRAISRLGKMEKMMELPRAIQTCLTKNLEKEDLNMITKNLLYNKYSDAIIKLTKSL